MRGSTSQVQLFAITHPKLGKPVKISLGKLSVQPERFQVRCGDSNNTVDGTLQQQAAVEAVTTMKEVVEAGGLLDPLLVWKDSIGDALIVFDGHHRMEAYKEGGAKSSLKVWTQLLNVEAEEEVRKFSYDLNSRVRLHMSRAERQEATWKAIAAGEAEGSLRDIAHSYGISKSQVALMKDKTKTVLAELRIQAADAGLPFDSAYILVNIGLWKNYAEWRESVPSGKPDIEAIRQKKIDTIVRSLSIKFGRYMKARPDDMLEAFAQFHQQATRRPVIFHVQREGEEGEEEEESDF